jgi:hypothetical protein
MSFVYVSTSGGRWDSRLGCSRASPAEVIDACNDTAVAIVRLVRRLLCSLLLVCADPEDFVVLVCRNVGSAAGLRLIRLLANRGAEKRSLVAGFRAAPGGPDGKRQMKNEPEIVDFKPVLHSWESQQTAGFSRSATSPHPHGSASIGLATCRASCEIR